MRAHIALFASTLLFGFNYWIAKGLMPVYFIPLQIIFFRVSVAFVLFWLTEMIFSRQKVEKKDIAKFAFAGLFGVSINQIMFFTGLNNTSPVDVALLHVLNPVLVLVFASLFIKEKITLFKLIGIILGAVGVIVLIISENRLSLSDNNLKGDLFILTNLTSYAIYLVIIKPLMSKYNTLTVMKWVFLFGFIFILPFTVSHLQNINLAAMPSSIIWSMLYVIIATTFIAYILVTYSLKFVDTSTASYYIYLQPVIVVIVGLYLGKDTLSAVKLLSGLMICTGVYFVSKKIKNQNS
jgi:drug/metabolite transporter (DMT)-like permease